MDKESLELIEKKLNILDKIKLKKFLNNISNKDIDSIKTFLNEYYHIKNLSYNFYNMFIYHVCNNYNKLFNILKTKNIYDLIDYLKNNEKIKNIENILNYEDYFELPNNKIKIIYNLLKNINLKQDELTIKKLIINEPNWLLRKDALHSENELKIISIKMYLSVGLENAIDILKENYGKIDYEIIYYLFNNLDIKNRNIKSNIIFNDFLFNNKKEPYNNMKLMLEGNLLKLFLNFDYFYNNINYFVKQLGIKLNRNKVEILLNEKFTAPIIENPEINGIILDDMISSYYHKYNIKDNKEDIINKNINIYNSKLKLKTKSSIINCKIPIIDNFIFELIPLNDPRNLVMGYRAGNCFRINGDASILFNNFLTNPHMRILSISTEKYKDFGMLLLMRNGNVLIAQGIELSNRVSKDIKKEQLYNATKLAVKYIMECTNKENDEIVATIIGLSNNNTIPFNNNILPFIINPILNENFHFYNGIYNYQALLNLKEGKTLNDIKLFIPNKFYNDNNKKYVRNLSNQTIKSPEMEKILISLRYARFKTKPIDDSINYYNNLIDKKEIYTICTVDWYITIYEDNTIDTYINSKNPEVIKEYNQELNKIKTLNNNQYKYVKSHNNILNEDLY